VHSLTALDLPRSVVITGVDSMEILEQAFTAARTFRRMSEAKKKALLPKTAEAATSGRFELSRRVDL